MTLVSLRVRDLATVADATLELAPGLNVLTGETGAGKSMLVDALALLLGDRADRAAVRPGASRAVIEGVFESLPPAARTRLSDAGYDLEESLVIRREISGEGRSRAWINGSPATMGTLADVGSVLVDLHGQHQTLQLLDAATQRSLLDAWAGAGELAGEVRAAHQRLAQLREEAGHLSTRREEALRRADWLRFVVAEINEARITLDEDEALRRERQRLAQVGTLAEHAWRLLDAVDAEEGGVRAALGQAERSVSALGRLDDDVQGWLALIENCYTQLDELARAARDYAERLSDDPGRLETVERRIALLESLKRKHGATLQDVLGVRDAAQAELDLLDSAAFDQRAVEARIAAAEGEYQALAARLSALRQRGGERLSGEVSRLLPQLGLSGGEFTVALEALSAPDGGGAERVEFVVRLNRGMPASSLARVASGGELSRLMLAIKVALAREDAVPTLVFDELDQGVGGEVAGRIGKALARVATRHQVLVITHLPQIAARADRHLRIAKATRGGVATSDLTLLHGEDRVLELARMLGNAEDDAARRLAAAMLRDTVSA